MTITIDPRALALLPFELRVEIAENGCRKDLAPSEIDALRRRCEAVLQEQAKARQAEAGPVAGRGAKPSGSRQLSQTGKGRTTDQIGAFAGVSGRTVEKIGKVVDAAERQPEKFAPLVAEMDRTGKVNGAYRKLRMAHDEERVNAIAPIEGKFRTLVVDPPWTYDLSLVGRAAPDYATMSHEELLALPVTGWAEDNCHLYLWTTNSFMTRAGELMAAWGFVHKTILTWVKPRWGLGGYFRNSTEHVLFGVRGELRTRSDSIATHFEAPVGRHSEKPERFYEIVRAASYGPFGEAFQRTARPDFVNLYREVGAAIDDDFARDNLGSETEGKNPIAESEDVG